MELNKWIKNWDERILKWYNNPMEEVESSIDFKFYNGKGKCSLNYNSLPEPYIGNPLKSSFVIINLNPGPTIKELQDHEFGSFTKHIIDNKSYYEKFKFFPYLQKNKENGGDKFWTNRIKWVNRLIKIGNQEVDDASPFALEIIPYHSQKFGSLNYTKQYINYLNQNVIEIAEKSLEFSQLNFVISVGKPFVNVFEKLRFNKIIDINKYNYPNEIEWQVNSKNEDSSRFFSLWRSPNGFYFYNTYAVGSNIMPALKWLDIEKYLINKIS